MVTTLLTERDDDPRKCDVWSSLKGADSSNNAQRISVVLINNTATRPDDPTPPLSAVTVAEAAGGSLEFQEILQLAGHCVPYAGVDNPQVSHEA